MSYRRRPIADSLSHEYFLFPDVVTPRGHELFTSVRAHDESAATSTSTPPEHHRQWRMVGRHTLSPHAASDRPQDPKCRDSSNPHDVDPPRHPNSIWRIEEFLTSPLSVDARRVVPPVIVLTVSPAGPPGCEEQPYHRRALFFADSSWAEVTRPKCDGDSLEDNDPGHDALLHRDRAVWTPGSPGTGPQSSRSATRQRRVDPAAMASEDLGRTPSRG